MTALAAMFAVMFVGLTGSAAVAAPVDCVLQTHRGACYEPIWVHGVQVTMTFPQAANQLPGSRNTNVMNFYVVAPQTDTPQGALPFGHDHVVPAMPGEPDTASTCRATSSCAAPKGSRAAPARRPSSSTAAPRSHWRGRQRAAADLGRTDRIRRGRGARRPTQRRVTVSRNDRPGQVRPSVRPPNQPAVICARARNSND